MSRTMVCVSSMATVLACASAARSQAAPREPMPRSTGRLPPEVIQRVIRQRADRFRACYEQARRTNARLAGRVTVRFWINRDGTVSGVSDGGSDMPDRGVITCVMRSVSGLTFPRPEGGIVIVTYPIVFSPNT
jgi:hypothetical protein